MTWHKYPWWKNFKDFKEFQIIFWCTPSHNSSKSFFLIPCKNLVSLRFVPSALAPSKQLTILIFQNLFLRQDHQPYLTKSLSVAYMTLRTYLTCTCSHYHQRPFSLKACISFLQSPVHYCMPRAHPNPLLMTSFPKYPLLSIGNKSLWMIFVIFRALGHAKFFMKFIKRHDTLEECESAKTNLFITRLFISSHRVILEIGSTYAWCMLSTHNHTTKHRQQSTGSSFAVLPLPGGARSSGRNTADSAASRLPGSFPSSRRWWCPSLSCARSTPSRPAASPASPGSSSALPGDSAACRTPPASYLGAPRGASPGRTRSTRGGRGLQHPPRRALPGSCALPLPPPDSEAAQRARAPAFPRSRQRARRGPRDSNGTESRRLRMRPPAGPLPLAVRVRGLARPHGPARACWPQRGKGRGKIGPRGTGSQSAWWGQRSPSRSKIGLTEGVAAEVKAKGLISVE